VRDEGVRLGIPFIAIDPVQDAVDVRGALPQDAFQPAAVFRRLLDLLRVAHAYRVDQVGEVDADLQEIHLPVVFERAVGNAHALGDPQRRQHGGRIQAGVGDVVDGEQGARPPGRQRVGVRLPQGQQGRQGGGVAVVAVNDVHVRPDLVQILQAGPDETDEPVRAVDVLLAGGRVGVDAVAVEEVGVVHEQHRDIRAGQAGAPHRHGMHAAGSQIDLGAEHLDRRFRQLAPVDLAVGRRHDGHPDALGHQRPRQRAHHVGQSAHLRQRRDFG